jgi:hypothetical protein
MPKITSNGKINFCIKNPIAPHHLLDKNPKACISRSQVRPIAQITPKTRTAAKTPVKRPIEFAVN